MKPILIFIAILVIPCAWRSTEEIIERHDTSPEYVVRGPSKLEVKLENGEYSPHEGPYAPKSKLSYCTERWSSRTVTARTTRKIVQKVTSGGGISRTVLYTFPSMSPNSPVDANPPGIPMINHVTVDLPDRSNLPAGKGYVIESSIEFPAHGYRDAQTYRTETEPFDVE